MKMIRIIGVTVNNNNLILTTMIKTYKQSNERQLTESIKQVKEIYVHAQIGNKEETIQVSEGQILSVLYEVFKDDEAKVKAVHIQNTIYIH